MSSKLLTFTVVIDFCKAVASFAQTALNAVASDPQRASVKVFSDFLSAKVFVEAPKRVAVKELLDAVDALFDALRPPH